MDLGKLIKNFHTVAILGTTKNAGKTTALNTLLDEEGVALTSIGVDGETVDSVTGTKKPRVFVRAGTLVATATGTLSDCTVTKELVCATGIPTPLGEIVVFRCVDDGFVKLAGPSISTELVALKKIFCELGAKRILIDGALARKSVATDGIVDGIVLSTGATLDADMDTVVDETAFLLSLYALPRFSHRVKPIEDAVAAVRAGRRILYTEGAVTDGMLRALSALRQVKGIVLGVESVSKIVASRKELQTFFARGGRLRVRRPVRVLAVTVNPFSAYGWSFEPKEFLQRMRARTLVPVLNVMEKDDEF